MRIYLEKECGELSEREAASVRAQMGDYAYEVMKKLYAETDAVVHWDYLVYKVMPTEVLISHGKSSYGREHAERNARQIIALCIELDRMEDMRGFTAA